MLFGIIVESHWRPQPGRAATLHKPESVQMMEWLASLRDPAAPAQVMGMVGEGRPFSEAFAEVFGQPLSETDRVFFAYANGPMAARYPTGMAAIHAPVPANGLAYVVFIGLRPNEAAKLDYRGRECGGEATVSANQLGFATYWIGEVPDRCVGAFTIRMTGSQGTSSSLELTFTPTNVPVAASVGRWNLGSAKLPFVLAVGVRYVRLWLPREAALPRPSQR